MTYRKAAIGEHTAWFNQWCAERESLSDLKDDSPGEIAAYDLIERLSLNLASSKPASLADLAAQVAWVKHELAGQMRSVATPAHDRVFDVMLKMIHEMDRATTGVGS